MFTFAAAVSAPVERTDSESFVGQAGAMAVWCSGTSAYTICKNNQYRNGILYCDTIKVAYCPISPTKCDR